SYVGEIRGYASPLVWDGRRTLISDTSQLALPRRKGLAESGDRARRIHGYIGRRGQLDNIPTSRYGNRHLWFSREHSGCLTLAARKWSRNEPNGDFNGTTRCREPSRVDRGATRAARTGKRVDEAAR